MIDISSLSSILEKIPNAFWGVIVGSFFSLGGVIISNRANDRRLRDQFEHDRTQKNRDRELALRRDIYLDATDAISAGMNALVGLANIDAAEETIMEKYKEKASAISKVSVIAMPETAKAVVELSNQLGSSFLRITAARIPLCAQKSKLQAIEESIKTFSAERDQMVELMKQFNLNGEHDDQKWHVLRDNYAFEQKRIDESNQEYDPLLADFSAKRLALLNDAFMEHTHIHQFLVPALVAIRKELDLPINEESYRKIFEDSLTHQKVSIEEFLQRISSGINAQANTQKN